MDEKILDTLITLRNETIVNESAVIKKLDEVLTYCIKKVQRNIRINKFQKVVRDNKMVIIGVIIGLSILILLIIGIVWINRDDKGEIENKDNSEVVETTENTQATQENVETENAQTTQESETAENTQSTLEGETVEDTQTPQE